MKNSISLKTIENLKTGAITFHAKTGGNFHWQKITATTYVGYDEQALRQDCFLSVTKNGFRTQSKVIYFN